jgi:hypothetical protein
LAGHFPLTPQGTGSDPQLAGSDPQMAQMAADFFRVSDDLLNLRHLRHLRIDFEAVVAGFVASAL